MAQSGSGSDKPARARTPRPKKQIACEEADGAVGGIALVDSFGFSSKPVVWAEVDGLAIVEGDIVIGTVDEARARDVSLLVSDQDPDGAVRSVGIDGNQFRWPGGVIPFEIDPGLTNPSRVTNAIAHWHAKTPLRLTPRAGETHFVRFVQGSGCSSPVGRRQTGAQNITLGPGCTVGNTIHEIGHAIGLWHEQSREDRAGFVRINFANIEAGKEHNFNQHISDGIDLGAYDYGSLMHYGPTAFSKNGLPTIEALQPLPPGVVMGQRDGLSAKDVAGVKLMYPGLNWPKSLHKEVVKETPDEVIKAEFKENVKENVKEFVKEIVKDVPDDGVVKPQFKEFVKEHRKEFIKEPQKEPIFDRQQLAKPPNDLPGRIGTNVLTSPVGGQQPFVLGRGSDFVSRYQAAQAGETGGVARSTEERAIALAEVVTQLDGLRAALAAFADELAGEAGV